MNTNTNRLMSCSTYSKSIYSSSSSSSTSSTSNKSKELHTLNTLIKLCFYSDENYAYRRMRLLLSSQYPYSPNVYDKFGCNLLMYTLRYQRYKLFEYLLNNLSLDLNFQAKDQCGNTILHYAIIYSGDNTNILEKLIEKYQKFSIKIDERNNFGFTPLLLAVFCGRYDIVLTLLTKTNASPFVRDYIQLKNMFDYIEIDIKNKEFQQQQDITCSNLQTKRLIHQLYQTIPSCKKTYRYKNFFEIFSLQTIQNQMNLFRSLIIKLYDFNYLLNLVTYLNQRYPKIKTAEQLKNISLPTKFLIQKENSKIEIHNILNLFDPKLKPKAILPSENMIPSTKTSLAFKRLSTKIGTISAFSKTQAAKARPSLITNHLK